MNILKPDKLSYSFLVLLLITSHPLMAEKISAPDSSKPQTIQANVKWEQIISFPGKVIYFPFGLFFTGIENSLVWYSSDQAKWLRKLLTPRVTVQGFLPAYSRRSGYGIKYYNNAFLSPDTRFTLSLKAGPQGRQKYEMKIKKLHLGSPFTSDISLLYRFLTIESFYGIGPHTSESNRTSFSHEIGKINFSLGIQPHQNLQSSLFIGLDHHNILRGKNEDFPSMTAIYSKKSLPGLDTFMRFFRIGFLVEHDSRNYQAKTTNGWESFLQMYYADQLQEQEYRFWKFEADLRRYIHLYYNRVIIFRIAAELTENSADHNIPFYYLSELGRHETIRGFDRGRFRDKHMVLSSLEYRYPVWRHITGTLFFDTGQVSPDIFHINSFEKLVYGYGFGFRIQTLQELFLKIELGFSQDGFRLYLNVND